MGADVVFGIITTIISIYWISVSSKLPGGTADGVPGAGYFPIIIASALIILSIVMIIQGLKNKKKYFDMKSWSKDNIKMFLLTLVFLGVFFILWKFVHYIAASLVMSFCLSIVYHLGWKKGALLSVIFSFTTYFVFSNLLHVLLVL